LENRPGKPAAGKGGAGMGRVIKLLVVLAILGFVGLSAYAYLGDMTPEPREIRLPVTLHAD